MIRPVLLITTSLLFAGCAHGGLMPTHEHRDFSSRAFEYALLAHNAYGDANSWISLPPDISLVVECDNDDIGLAYSVFRKERQGSDEYVFTFRGTEGFGAEGKKDWRYGNLSFFQQVRSEPIVRRFAEAHPNDELVFVGHSLGGALAIHNSMRVQGKRVYVFNSSPKFFAPKPYDPSSDPSQRISIAERGEVLKPVRMFFKEAWQTYMPFNCFGKGGPIYQHSMLRLGICLTRIAASESGTPTAVRARQFLDRNAWAVEETTHPLAATKPTAPCVR